MSETARGAPAPTGDGARSRAELHRLASEVRPLVQRWPLPPEEDQAWRDAARCRGLDPDLFYPTRGGDPEPAKAICRQCRVRTHCLAAAIAGGETIGTWGGLTELERRQLRRLVLVRE